MISDAEKADIKARNPCDQVAAQWVTLRKHGKKLIGSCPICSSDPAKRSATRFEVDTDGWVCAACSDGGDVIKLVMLREGIDFRGAVERLGGTREVDPEQERARQAELEIRNQKREQQTNFYRENERGRLYDIWTHAAKAPGTPVEGYLELRRLALPPGDRLRCVPKMPYFAHGGSDAPVIHRGPAMVVPIVRDGRFCGMHLTYLDLAQPKGKARIVDPQTGELLPAKKVRGSKTGGSIVLARVDQPRHMIVGEGIETTLAAWRALAELGRDLSDTEFRSGVDLGNIGGRAIETIAHPELTTPTGRARHVPGPDPDLTSAAIAIPGSVEDLVLLGDGDSDRVLTECALYRASQRFGCEGRVVRVAWAPPAEDFNDILMRLA